MEAGPVRSWCAPHSAGSLHAQPGLGHVAMVDQGHATAAGEAGPGAGGAHLGRRGVSSDAEKIAGRIVEYGTVVEEANWSML
jgi:hypothetical protein